MSALEELTSLVKRLDEECPSWVDACTDPEGRDVAELFAAVQEARVALQDVERWLEGAAAQAMLSDCAETGTLRVERRRAADRKAWDHESWQRDVRQKVLQASGLKGVRALISADGEELPPSVLGEAVARLQRVHGSTAPRAGELRGLGLDPDDYAERSPGRWMVRVTRMVDEGGSDGE